MCYGNDKEWKNIKALCFVAHPDDCIIYAKPFIDATPYLEWSILYLTHHRDHPRSKEISNYWNHKTYHLEQPDYMLDNITGISSISKRTVLELVKPYMKDVHLLLTHGKDGEYGHIHHKLVHSICHDLSVAKIFFSNDGIMFSNKQIDTKSLPIHEKAIIKYFNPVRMYDISDEARSIIIEAKRNGTR
jgi:hypothetical protein